MVRILPAPRRVTFAGRASCGNLKSSRKTPYDVVIGLDCSLTSTGIAVLQWDGNTWKSGITQHTQKLASLPDPERQFAIVDAVIGIIEKYTKDYYNVAVVIEDYAFGKTNGKSFTRAELVGMIKYRIKREFGLDIFLVAPSAMKRYMECAGIKGKKAKEAVARMAYAKFHFVSSCDDIIDAHCVARYLIANREGQRLTLVKL